MNDKYENFAQLAQNEEMDKDFTIIYRKANPELAVIAPYGGGIEPGTIDIADVLAGCDYTFYAFKALKSSENRFLHITSNRFDEPLGLEASQNVRVSITTHGSKFRNQIVHIGGRHQALKQEITLALRAAGFDAQISEIPGLRGIKPENICNQCRIYPAINYPLN